LANERSRGAATDYWLQGLNRRQFMCIAGSALAAALAALLVASPALWYIGGTAAGRHHEVMAGLAELGTLDARWEREALRALNDFAPGPAVDHAATVAEVTKPLEAAAKSAPSRALERSLPDVMRAFGEKAMLARRFAQAHGDSRQALRETLAMEAEIAGLLREAWREAPDRQRLVAIDNVVTQLFADVQRYYFTPADSVRKNLEESIADLRGAAAVLPGALKPAVTRLDHHVAALLRARPQEQAAFDRMRFHAAGPRAAALARELRAELDRGQLERERYRVYLSAYFCALLVLIAYLAARLIGRELVLRRAHGQTAGTAASEHAQAEPTLPPSADAAP
jgi:hypothetical protein